MTKFALVLCYIALVGITYTLIMELLVPKLGGVSISIVIWEIALIALIRYFHLKIKKAKTKMLNENK